MLAVTGLIAPPSSARPADPSPVPSPGPGDQLARQLVRPAPDRAVPARALGSEAAATAPFTMVGFTGVTTDVVFRVRTRAGWSRWHVGHTHEGADATQPVWTGPARGIQLRERAPRGVRLVLIDSHAEPGDGARPPGLARRVQRRAERAEAHKRVPAPALRTRRQWRANESWRNGSPTYNRVKKQVHVHHTASGNSYRRRDVPALLRGFYRYHTKYLGWSDIGYNYLIDRFGRTWVGRAGGPRRWVRGAHTLGFNHNSTGVALIGNFQRHRPSKASRRALVRLIAWRLDRVEGHPRGRVWVRSEGSDRFPAGRLVQLPVVAGHRQTNDTSCPGRRLYDRLPKIRKRAGRTIRRFNG